MYCGPFALHFTTRGDHDEIVQKIKEHRNSNRPVRGVWHYELVNVLKYYGVGFSELPRIRPKITLARWLKITKRHPKWCYIVMITGHYVVIKGRKLYDNCNRKGVWLRRYNHRRRRVFVALECRVPF